MSKLRIFLTSLLVVLALAFTGCGSDNSEVENASGGTGTGTGTIPDITDDEDEDALDINDTQLTVLLIDNSKTVTLNGESFAIDVRVIDGANNPYSAGNVNIVFPNDVRDGRDVGSFESLSVTPDNNGIATFNYTAPKTLSTNTNNIYFGFYHVDNPSDIQQFTITIEPEANQSTLTTYEIKSSLVSGSLTMDLNSTKTVSFSVIDDAGNQLDSDSITSISMTLLNSPLADIQYKGVTYDTTVTMNDPDKNTLSVNLVSFTRSGIVPIEVTANFINSDGNADTVDGIFNFKILSGPPTAMSIVYEGTSHDEVNAKFVDRMVITVTDKYFNKVNTNPAVTGSLIVGYAQEIANPATIYYDTATYDQYLAYNSLKKTALDSRIFLKVQTPGQLL